MSFETTERSNYDSIPTALYEFAIGLNTWRYSSGEVPVTIAGNVYAPMPISDNGIVQSGDVQNDDFVVTLPADTPIASLFIGTPPSSKILVAVRRMNYGENDAPVVWVGEVKSGKRISLLAFEITCKTLSASLNRNGLRLAWSRSCPHALYDQNCKADPNAFGVSAQVDMFTGGTIASAAFDALPDGYLSGGYFEWEMLSGVMERRGIENHTGAVLIVLGTTDGLAPGQFVNVYPGCDRISSTCQLKFNNLSNNGGFPHMPSKSPFDGDPIF